jgi:hypothetical protein
MRSVPSVARAVTLTVGWVLAAAVLGPVAYGVGVLVQEVMRGNQFWQHDPLAVPVVILGLASLGIPSILINVPLLAPLLAAWALIARRWTRLESVVGILVGTLSLAGVAALTYFVAVNRDQRPLAPHGLPVLVDALQWGGLVWVALLLPRVVIPALRHGAFATDR